MSGTSGPRKSGPSRTPGAGRSAVASRLTSVLAVPLALVLMSGVLAITGAPAAAAPAPAAALEAGPASAAVVQQYLTTNAGVAEKLANADSACSFSTDVRASSRVAPSTRCAEVTVPMDWKHPAAHEDITIAIAFSKATGTSKGLLTANPGGPGVAGLDFTAYLAVSKPELSQQYDLLGLDPRGFGESANDLECRATQAEVDDVGSVPDLRQRNPKTHAVEVASARLLAKACASSEISQFIGTQQTVYDLDFLRALLDYPHLNYIGYSYGTWLGTWYADTYPSRVGRFILDSNMQWTASMYANQESDSASFQRRRDKMLFPWIARRDDAYGLGRTAAAVARSYERVRAQMVADYASGDSDAAPELLDWFVVDTIYTDSGFESAAAEISIRSELGSGEDVSKAARRASDRRIVKSVQNAPVGVQLATGVLETKRVSKARVPTVVIDAAADIVRCNDTPYSGDLQAYLRRADADAKRYPFIGYQNTVPSCAFWPYRQNARTIDLTGVPQMLMFQSEGDPATAYEGALAAHRLTPKATRLVSVNDVGQHTLYIDGPSPCVERAGDAFLFSAKAVLPSQDTVCAAKTSTPLPEDTRIYPLNGPVNDQPSKGPGAQTRSRTAQPDQTGSDDNDELAKIREDARIGSVG